MHESTRRLPRLIVPVLVATGLAAAGCGGEPARARPLADAPGGSGPRELALEPPVGVHAGGLVVDVAGAVREPGVYRMPAGARVHEALEAAGGLRSGADTTSINRAAPVVDGQQLLVPTRGTGGSAGSTAASTAGDGAISINTADATLLDELPGIGPVTAERIVAERDGGGPFATLDDLDRVPGIGPATIESLRDVAVA